MNQGLIKYLFGVAAGVFFIGLFVGLFCWRTIPVYFVHYLVWRLTSTVSIIKGQVRVGKADIHYVSYGDGPAVLLLHGGLSNRLSWFAQLPVLVDSGRRVIMPDSRGHGDSTLGDDELSYRLLAADAVRILDQLGIAQTDVVGWSDGGNTALLLGRYWPTRVRRMVVISANARPEGLTPEAQQDNSKPSHGVGRWLKQWWTGAGDRIQELENRVRQMWRTRPTLKRADLERITAPTLVIVGKSDVVSQSHARFMSKWLANGSLTILPGGHMTPVTQARRVNALIVEFLGQTTAHGDTASAPHP